MEKVIQWNCRSINAKKSDLLYLINLYHPFVISIQESWLRPGSCFKVANYSCIREDRFDRFAGTALLIHNSIPFIHIPIPNHNTKFSIVAAKINNICFVSVYIPHPSSSIYNEVEQIISMLPKPILILGDFNAQHQSWGSHKSNYYGGRILDMLDKNNLCLLNTGLPTRRTLPNEGPSAPDLSICNPNLASSLAWTTHSFTYGSDHFPIIITFPTLFGKTSVNRSPRMKYKLSNDSSWSSYKERVDQKIDSLLLSKENNFSLCAESFASILIESADEIFPYKYIGSRKIPSPPWWDQECSEAVKKRKEAEKNYKLNSTMANFNILSDLISNTRKLIKKKKWEGWQKFCSSISPDTPPSAVWNNIRRFRSAFKESRPHHLEEEIADQFLDNLAPPYAPEYNIILASPGPSVSIHSGINSPFSFYELKGVLSHVKDSTPGIDGIPYSFISHLNDSSLSYFLSIINSVVFSGVIPPSWKSQEVIPILKPNKPPLEASSYRPISLSSVLAKIAEHLVKNRLEWFIESNGLLANSQYGFRKGRSTMDSIGLFTADIRLAFSRNKSILAAFLDISAAYDSVLIPILRNKLSMLNVPSTLINFIVNMLLDRSIHIIQEDYNSISTKSRIIWKGLPQGSVLSPLLYNIYTYDLQSSIDIDGLNILQYADDLLFYVVGNSVNKLSRTLTFSLESLKTWLDCHGLNLSVSKSSVVLFSRMRIPPSVTVSYNGSDIKVEKQAKFLGVILDSNFTGLPHCYYITAKCERALNILRCLSGVWWGAHPFSLRLMYNALIRSVLDYGSYFLEPCSATGLNLLDSIQYKALRIILGAMKSSPINAMQIECGEPPLRFRRQLLCDKFIFRSLQFLNNSLYSKLRTLSNYIESSSYWTHKKIPCMVISFRKFISLQAPSHRTQYLPIFCSDFDSLVLSPSIYFDFGISKNDNDPNTSLNFILDRDWQDWHHVYSDASKHSNTGFVGIGVYHHQFGIIQKIKFPPETSVHTGEFYGLVKAVEYVLLMKLPKSLILTDSKSALQALERFPFYCGSSSSPVAFECRKLLHKASLRGQTIHFGWIPGHHGIYGNERANSLANDAVVDGDMFPYKNFCSDLLALPNFHLLSQWNEDWEVNGQIKGRYYKLIQPNIPVKPWFHIMKLGKTATTCIIRMRLGHVCTPAHLARLHIIDSDICECGADIGDLNHIFFSCSQYDHSSLFTSLISHRIPLPTSIITLLYMNNTDIYNILSIFISSNNIKI